MESAFANSGDVNANDVAKVIIEDVAAILFLYFYFFSWYSSYSYKIFHKEGIAKINMQ